MNKKQAIQFEEGDVLLYCGYLGLTVCDGRWQWVEDDGPVTGIMSDSEQAILDRLTEIVKPLRTHKLGAFIYREDGWTSDGVADHGEGEDEMEWSKLSPTEFGRDLFQSWGWPIPAHMEDK